MRINKIVLDVVAVCAVLLLIGLLVVIYNKQKVGKSDNPAAQKAALTLLAGIPVHWQHRSPVTLANSSANRGQTSPPGNAVGDLAGHWTG